ncbi:hypothetical protein Pmani_007796 [Petrolisthes manimaculis]|uniref:FAD dependent oxidoreductase domain-containing protein n=1 Tax=Petrolisthes manimaculis TaxID=1843537 RepID=A0AAE1Q7K9_9EUCA|nr:hypothetical protein Pmani_007796 [Petrolisthes manimaculis]
MMEVEVVVVGAGVVGACTALSLIQEGKKTLLIDQYTAPNSLGSSMGQSRITRHAHSGPKQLSPILNLAHKKWAEISSQVNEELISPAQMLVVSHERKEVERLAESMKQSGLTPSWLTPKQTNTKYKTRFPDDTFMFEDRSGGVMKADRCLAAVMRLYREKGGEVLEGWKVEGVEERSKEGHGGVRVWGPKGEVRALSVVLCLGPWINSLQCNLNVHLPIQPIKTRASFMRNEGLPNSTIYYIQDSAVAFYILPAMDSEGLIKVGTNGGLAVTPDNDDEGDKGLTHLKEMIADFSSRYLPLHPEEERHETCWYSETPDKEFMLDRHPQHPDILLVVGFSSTGFKTAPAIGHIAAHMVVGKDHGFDISPFSVHRFIPSKSKI